MNIQFAHLRERSTTGTFIDFAVFDAKSSLNTNSSNSQLLGMLTQRARSKGLKIDQSALVYKMGSQTKYYGDRNLVSYLSRMGVPKWTHKLTA